ncbi:MAG: trypco2 family protein [Pseudonocardiaceae bacterium]
MDLSEAIEALRESLKTSMQLGKSDWMQFVLDPIELEVETVVTKDANGKVGWKII